MVPGNFNSDTSFLYHHFTSEVSTLPTDINNAFYNFFNTQADNARKKGWGPIGLPPQAAGCRFRVTETCVILMD